MTMMDKDGQRWARVDKDGRGIDMNGKDVQGWTRNDK
jgi:hypothetical protein